MRIQRLMSVCLSVCALSIVCIGANKSLLVFPIEPDEGGEALARKWTAMLSKGLMSQSYIDVQNGWDLVSDSAIASKAMSIHEKGLQCQTIECAGIVAKELGYSHALLTKINRVGMGLDLESEMIETSLLKSIWKERKNYRQGRKELIEGLTGWGKGLAKILVAKAITLDEISTTTIGHKNDSTVKRDSFDIDLNTSHLQGTRIYGVMADTLRANLSPYIVTSNLIVPSGGELVIEPGVQVYIGGEYTTITVLGKMIAKGTKEKPIQFQSGKKDPKPWDWDRILFRSRSRSILEWVEVSHSNYGVAVQTAAVTLINCHIHHNSVRGIFAEDADVEIRDSRIDGGQLVGIQIVEYANVLVERTIISGNHNGISLQEFGGLKLRHSTLTENDRAMIIVDSVLLEMEGVRISKNRIGIMSNAPLSPRLFDGLRGNETEISIVPREKLSGVLEKPASPREERKIVLLSQSGSSQKSRSFHGGIISSKDRGVIPGLLGNVTLTSEVHLPKSASHDSYQPATIEGDTIQKGQRYPQDKIIPGYYQGLSGFLTYEQGPIAIEANANFLWDVWGKSQWPGLSIQTKLGSARLSMGDFSENSSEIGLYSLSMRGIKMGMGFDPNRQGDPKLEVTGAIGETERPYDENERVLGSYLECKSEGSAVAQRMVSLGDIAYHPFTWWDIHARTIWSEDRRDAILRSDLSRTAVTAQPLLNSRLFSIDHSMHDKDQKWTFEFELAVGTVDSTTIAYDRAVRAVLSDSGFSASEVTLLTSIMKPTAKDTFIESNLAGALSSVFTSQDSIDVRDSLVSAGSTADIDDVLRSHRMQILSGLIDEAKLREDGEQKVIESERTGGVNFDEQGWANRLRLARQWGNGSLEFSYLYIGNDFYTGGNPYLVRNRRSYGSSLSQDFGSRFSLGLGYSLDIENASGMEAKDLNILGFSEVPGITQPEWTHASGLEARWNVLSNLEITGTYALEHKSQEMEYTLNTDSARVFADPSFSTTDTVAAEVIYLDNTLYYVDTSEARAYRDLSRHDSIPLGNTKISQELEQTWGLQSKIRLSANTSVALGGTWRYLNDYAEFKDQMLMNALNLEDTTLIALGYYPKGEDQWEQVYDVSYMYRWQKWNNKLSGKWGIEKQSLRKKTEWTWSIKDQLGWEPIKRKLKFSLSGSYQWNNYHEDALQYFVLDTSGQKWFYYLTDSLGNVSGVQNQRGAILVSSSEPAIYGTQIFAKSIRTPIYEHEIEWELMTRYTLDARSYVEASVWQNIYLRPQALDQQYSDFAFKVLFFYSL